MADTSSRFMLAVMVCPVLLQTWALGKAGSVADSHTTTCLPSENRVRRGTEMTTPPMILDVIRMMLALAAPAALLCLVLAGIAMRREGGRVPDSASTAELVPEFRCPRGRAGRRDRHRLDALLRKRCDGLRGELRCEPPRRSWSDLELLAKPTLDAAGGLRGRLSNCCRLMATDHSDGGVAAVCCRHRAIRQRLPLELLDVGRGCRAVRTPADPGLP